MTKNSLAHWPYFHRVSFNTGPLNGIDYTTLAARSGARVLLRLGYQLSLSGVFGQSLFL
jgi:hypothetical protein